MRIFCAALLVLSFVVPEPNREPKAEIAYELDCPDVTIIVNKPGQITLKLAHELAECLGSKSTVCTLQVIRLKRE